MTVPEWASILLISGVFVVIWWGVQRLVKTNDGILAQIVTINNRLVLSEAFMKFHHEADEKAFREITEKHKELWHAINNRKD